MPNILCAVFVYGTLKRGGVRERCWPHRPLHIEPATVRGTLYDLGPYPALTAGEDCIAGELWHLAPEDVEATLRELDRVEGFRGRADDLYQRVTATCQTTTGPVQAWTYRYAQLTALKPQQRLAPNGNGVCEWSGGEP